MVFTKQHSINNFHQNKCSNNIYPFEIKNLRKDQSLVSYVSFENIPVTLQDKVSQGVWAECLERHKSFLNRYKNDIYDTYIEGFSYLDFKEDKIPSLDSLLDKLKHVGWNIAWVDGYISASIYASLISEGCFPISSVIRKKKFITHSPIPDFIHDVLGHLPILIDQEYTTYLRSIARALSVAHDNKYDKMLYTAEANIGNLRHMEISSSSPKFKTAEIELYTAQKLSEENPSFYSTLRKLFLWTIEFGLIKDNRNNIKILGAGILSAHEEALNIINKKIEFSEWTHNSINEPFTYFSDLQPKLFVARNINDYNEALLNFLNNAKM